MKSSGVLFWNIIILFLTSHILNSYLITFSTFHYSSSFLISFREEKKTKFFVFLGNSIFHELENFIVRASFHFCNLPLGVQTLNPNWHDVTYEKSKNSILNSNICKKSCMAEKLWTSVCETKVRSVWDRSRSVWDRSKSVWQS